MPRVSIVIPAYNAGRFLAATINSALASTIKDLEVVVVNDGSGDATQAIAESYPSHVRVINQRNAGMSFSRNRGIASGDSEFVALLDSDDVWHPTKLEAQLRALSERPDYGFSFTDFTFWNGESRNTFSTDVRTGSVDPEFDGWVYHRLIVTNWALPSSVVFRRTACTALGPFLCDDYKTDDWEYLVRASWQYRAVRLSEPMVLYRQHPQSLSQRVSELPVGEVMRRLLLNRYGTSSPDGKEVDRIALDWEEYQGWSNFADTHCARGELAKGLKIFMKLLASSPHRHATAMKLAKSLYRRLRPKRLPAG